MSVYKDRGIILKEYAKGEYDRQLTVLLKDHGKVQLYAKGARKPKSKLFAGTSLFSYSEFMVFEGNGFSSVTQVEIISSFHAVTADYERYCLACYFLELANLMIHPGMRADIILYLLLKALQAICRENASPALVSAAYKLKFMQLEGYSPDESSIRDNGLARVIEHILEAEVRNLFNMRLDEKTICKLANYSDSFIKENVDVNGGFYAH